LQELNLIIAYLTITCSKSQLHHHYRLLEEACESATEPFQIGCRAGLLSSLMRLEYSFVFRKIGKIAGHAIFLWYSDTGFSLRSFYNHCSHLGSYTINGGTKVRALRFLALLFVMGFFIISCSDSDDDSGTAGGSGEVNKSAAVKDSANNEPASTESDDTAAQEEPSQPAAPVSSSEIWMDASSDWNCGGNWTERDGALGLVAYSGNDSCSISFPGESGSYQLVLTAQTEFDGQSPYSVSINGQTVASGDFPWSSSLKCDCPKEDWRSVCPDKNTDIDLGTHNLNPGDVIEFWGADDYPCGSHGSYAKWHGITAYKR
jgi:hypothetical protein